MRLSIRHPIHRIDKPGTLSTGSTTPTDLGKVVQQGVTTDPKNESQQLVNRDHLEKIRDYRGVVFIILVKSRKRRSPLLTGVLQSG
jgi:hypothetical protein